MLSPVISLALLLVVLNAACHSDSLATAFLSFVIPSGKFTTTIAIAGSTAIASERTCIEVSSAKQSAAWKYFLVRSNDSSLVKCKLCATLLKTKSSTSPLRYHLQHKTGNKFEDLGLSPATTDASSSSSQVDKARVVSYQLWMH
jgi:hypothetical protein